MPSRKLFLPVHRLLALVFCLVWGCKVYGVQPDESQCRNVVKEYLSSFDDSLTQASRTDSDWKITIEYSSSTSVFRSRELAKGEIKAKPYSSETHVFSNMEWGVRFMERTVGERKYDGFLIAWKLDETPLARFSTAAESFFIVDKQNGKPASQFVNGPCVFSAKGWPVEHATLTFMPVSGSKHVFHVGPADRSNDEQQQLVVKQIGSYFNLNPELGDKKVPVEQRHLYEERIVTVASFQETNPFRAPKSLSVFSKARLVNGTEYPETKNYLLDIQSLNKSLGEEIEFIGRSIPTPSPVSLGMSPDIPHVFRGGKIFKVIDENLPIGSVAVESRNYQSNSFAWVFWTGAISFGVIISVFFIRHHWGLKE